jgi:endonuclease/exonuclease/phosphatase family metal-dependent hydrolase
VEPAVNAVATVAEADPNLQARGPRQRRQVLFVSAVLLAWGAFILQGARTTPADPVEPLKLEASDALQSLDASPTLRIATFNIHAGVGEDGVRDLGRTAKSLVDSDFAALQEVRSPVLDNRGPQVSEIAEKLHLGWLFAPAERHWWHDDYGTALLTRTPLVSTIRVPLPTSSRRRFRSALLANFRYQGRIIHVLAVHIDRDTRDNTHEKQLQTVADLFLSLGEPAILLGDMNEIPSHPIIRRLLESPGVANALAVVPQQQRRETPLDWIITRGFRPIRAEWRESEASDHPAGWAELQLIHGEVRTADGNDGPRP